jgi:ABC-type uncharacterized transport system involved in gliding motility auxiliary subunit
MSKAGRILFGFSMLAFVILTLSRAVYGGWHDSFWVPLVLFVVLGAIGVFKEWQFLKEVALLRTTKYGMNTGASVAIALVALVCINVIASRYDKKFDLTKERLNSLSDQSIRVAKAISADTQIVVLTGKEANASGEDVVRGSHDLVDMYHNVNNKIQFVNYDALTRPDMAQKYDYTYGPFATYVVQGERKLKIDRPNEESITRALLKLSHDKKKTIYFVRGHGEIMLDTKEPRGLSTIQEDLSVTYDLKSLALFENKDKVPADADVVAIVGPTAQFLDSEIQGLREYVRGGGNLFLALDPGSKQNLAQLTKSFGVEFKNDFVLDLRSQALKAAPTLVLGTDFSRDHEVTRAFRAVGNQMALFELASSLVKAPDAAANLKVEPLIKTDATTANFNELKDKIEFKPNGPHILAMTVTGKVEESGPNNGKEFNVVVFGDSDFLANRLVHNNLNRDLVENSFSWLASDKELISIRPKEPKGNKLVLVDTSRILLTLGLFGLTLLLFAMSLGFWWRRRMA